MDFNDGLIFTYILDGEGGGNAVDWKGIRDWRPEKGALRINLDCSNEHVEQRRENHMHRIGPLTGDSGTGFENGAVSDSAGS